MPINEKFLHLDPNSYNLSVIIDKEYDLIMKQLFPIQELTNDRDVFELCHNYKIINDCYNMIKKDHMNYNPSKYNLDSFKECIIYNFNIRTRLINSFCKEVILSDQAVDSFNATLYEEMTLLNFVYNINAMIESGKKINFIFIFYRIDNYNKFIKTNVLENTNISITDKNFFSKYTFNNNCFYKYFELKFFTYAEINIYKKIFSNSHFMNDKVVISLIPSPKILIKQTIIVNEAIDFFIKEAKDIFKVRVSEIISVLSDLKLYITQKLRLFECDNVELRKLEKMMIDVDQSIEKAESINDYKDVMQYIKQTFPNIRKTEFVNYVVNKLGIYLENNKDSNFLAKMRYNNFVKEFNYDAKNNQSQTIEIPYKFVMPDNPDYKALESLAKYYISRKRAFNIDEILHN